MKFRSIAISLFILVASFTANANSPPVPITGETGARGELLENTLYIVTSYASAYECDSIKSIETRILPNDRIPRYASYRVKDKNAIYERWDVNFCGKFVKFMIIFVPDSNGGTFVSVSEYPDDAL